MNGFLRAGTIAGLIALVMAGTPSRAFAQARQRGAGDEPAVTPFELQKLFDSYALVQAQQFLGIGDDQYARFLPRFMALQGARRQGLQQRTRVLNDVRKLVNDPQSSDEQMKNALKQLQDIDERASLDVRKASEAVDQALDLRQQAKFRIFEEQMDRRKLELVTRARRANRANDPKPQQ